MCATWSHWSRCKDLLMLILNRQLLRSKTIKWAFLSNIHFWYHVFVTNGPHLRKELGEICVNQDISELVSFLSFILTLIWKDIKLCLQTSVVLIGVRQEKGSLQLQRRS